jgi:hypothetical protein
MSYLNKTDHTARIPVTPNPACSTMLYPYQNTCVDVINVKIFEYSLVRRPRSHEAGPLSVQ